MRRINRRELLGAAAATAMAGTMLAREAHATAVPESIAPRTPAAAGRAENPLALLDGMLAGDDLARARATLVNITRPRAPATPIARLEPRLLEPDLLWQWRRELAQELRRGSRAIAITRWDKAFVLKGLARESALRVRQVRIGHSLFQTEIG